MTLDAFRDAYLDHLEGLREDPPDVEEVRESERPEALAWVRPVNACRGIALYVERSSIEALIARYDRRMAARHKGHNARS